MLRLALSQVAFFLLLQGSSGTRHANAGQAAESVAPPITHPLVGVWRLRNASFVGDGGSFPSVAIFHPVGSYIEIMPWGAVLMGAWKPTGERTADLLFLANDILDDRLVQGEGRTLIEVDASGDRISLLGNFVSHYEDGTLDMAVEAPATGSRLDVLPMVNLDATVAPADLAPATPMP
jgi:hypothetical protein